MKIRYTFFLLLISCSIQFLQAEHVVSTKIFLTKPELPSNAVLFATLAKDWKITASGAVVTAQSLSFEVPSGIIECTLTPQVMQKKDWYAYSTISWLWKSAEQDLAGHQAYLNIKFTAKPTQSVFDAELDLARVHASIFQVMTGNAIGLLNSDRYLLIDGNLYRETMKNLPVKAAPVYLLVYVGMSTDAGKNSGFTFGLNQLNLPEMEVVKSDRTAHEVHAILVQSVEQVLLGEKMSISKDQKTTVSEGVFVQGQTIKIKV
jgi:hypothetical protein